MSAQQQVDALRERVNSFAIEHGIEVASSINKNSALVLQWLPYLDRLKTSVADELVAGVGSSLVEAAACASLGLVRPALFSMRTEIDVILTWLYFKDHRIEWESVNATGDGFKLKKEMFEYFTRYFDGFGERYGILKSTATRKEVDTYRFLSAHIHSQSTITLPVANKLVDVVRDRKTGDELAEIAKAVDEYISDVLMALFAKDWTHIPRDLMKYLDGRFKTTTQRSTFFKTVV